LLTTRRNAALLSFGAEPEEAAVDPSLVKSRFKSAHDALDDERLSKQVLDDRGTSATLPPGMEGPAKKRKGVDEPKKGDEVGLGGCLSAETGAHALRRIRTETRKDGPAACACAVNFKPAGCSRSPSESCS
jgi:hypothetical protein